MLLHTGKRSLYFRELNAVRPPTLGFKTVALPRGSALVLRKRAKVGNIGLVARCTLVTVHEQSSKYIGKYKKMPPFRVS